MTENAALETPQAPEQDPTHGNVLDDIDALLSGSPGEPDENGFMQEDETEQPEKAQVPEPDREEEEPEEAAQEATEEAQQPDIDYDLEIPMPDGREAMTLGQMKDKVNELERTESQMIERENALLRERQELDKVMAAVGEIPPELRQQADAMNQQHLQQERGKMLEAIPEWSDRETFERDRTAIAEVGHKYGFSDIEIGTIADHRVIKFMRDYSRMAAAEQQAQETAKQVHRASKPAGKKPRAKTRQSALDKQVSEAMQSNNETVRLDAIDKLLGA